MPNTLGAASGDDDCTLVQRARGGGDEALTELFHRYERVVRQCSGRMSHTGLDIEDLVQEGMIGFLSAVRTFDAERGASFHTYAVLCVKRRLLSAVRSASRQKHQPLNNYVSLDDESNEQTVALTSAVNPEDMIVCRESIGVLKDVVGKCLTASERGILNLYISGVSYAAIAEVLHVSVKSVDNSLQKIKKKLLVSVED